MKDGGWCERIYVQEKCSTCGRDAQGWMLVGRPLSLRWARDPIGELGGREISLRWVFILMAVGCCVVCSSK